MNWESRQTEGIVIGTLPKLAETDPSVKRSRQHVSFYDKGGMGKIFRF